MDAIIEILKSISSAFFCYYTSFAGLLLILKWVFKSARKTEVTNLLYVLHFTVAIFTLLNTVFTLYTFIAPWFGQNDYEWYAFNTSYISIDFKLFFGYLFFLSILGLFFFLKKLRINTNYIVFYIAASSFGHVLSIVKLRHKDIVPSYWKSNITLTEYLANLLISVVLLTILYIVLHKRKKLPYSSQFLK